jgi:hypothetical protein
MELGERIISYMTAKGYRVRAQNIIYLEDCLEDGTPTDGKLDAWDDRSLIVTDKGVIKLNATATCEPGAYWTRNPMNRLGAARIAIGQHKDAWELGYHRRTDHPALVQCDDVKVIRDTNNDGRRSDRDFEDIGQFGINQHGCYGDGDVGSIGHWSAGCLVRLYWRAHKRFIQMCRDSGNKRFDTTIIDPTDLLKWSKGHDGITA